MSDKIGGGLFVTIELGPGETVVKEGDVWHRQAPTQGAWFSWPPPSFGKLALTNRRLLYSPPKRFFLSLDRKLQAPLSAIRSVTMVTAPRTGEAVMQFHRSFSAWETLRIGINSQLHWFAMQYYTLTDQAELEAWLNVISAATGLEARREHVVSG